MCTLEIRVLSVATAVHYDFKRFIFHNDEIGSIRVGFLEMFACTNDKNTLIVVMSYHHFIYLYSGLFPSN